MDRVDPFKLRLPLSMAQYADVCSKCREISARIRTLQSHKHGSHQNHAAFGSYRTDEAFVDVQEAEAIGLLPAPASRAGAYIKLWPGRRLDWREQRRVSRESRMPKEHDICARVAGCRHREVSHDAVDGIRTRAEGEARLLHRRYSVGLREVHRDFPAASDPRMQATVAPRDAPMPAPSPSLGGLGSHGDGALRQPGQRRRRLLYGR